LEYKEIKQIVELMDQHGLTEFELDRDGDKISLRRGPAQGQYSGPPAAPQGPIHQLHGPVIVPPAETTTGAPEEKPEVALPTINSPMVGSFYRRPAPDDAPFVKVGDVVDEDTVICIVEAMKVMNEVKAEMSGTITRVIAEDNSPVQYGEALFEIKPS
jgi:acetyl-CoA carboxylase biotin carboxyl carrier protein